MSNFGYHAGDLKNPSETLTDRGGSVSGISVPGSSGSKTGWLGTGHYFYGNELLALVQAYKQKRPVQIINLDSLKLFTVKDADTFYDGVQASAAFIMDLAKENVPIEPDELKKLDSWEEKQIAQDAQNTLQEIIEWWETAVGQDAGIKLSRSDVESGVREYYNQIQSLGSGGRKATVLLSNLILQKSGFDGIDNRDSSKDHYGTGSVIFADGPLDSSLYSKLYTKEEVQRLVEKLQSLKSDKQKQHAVWQKFKNKKLQKLSF